MEHDIGIACGRCDTFHPMGAAFCSSCGNDLSFRAAAAAAVGPAAGVSEDPMEQNRYYVCKECSSPVPPGHKFCGACGATVPDELLEKKVEFFGTMQAPGKARLILIRGTDGADGLSYLLQGTEHVTGRTN